MKPKNDFYLYTDKIISYLNKQFIRLFGNLKSTIPIDELNVLQSVKELYLKSYQLVQEMLYKLSVIAYDNAPLENFTVSKPPELEWVLLFFDRYDPITKYVFSAEVERKSARCYESLIASTTKPKEVDTALRYWSAMVNQYAIEITDEAVLKAYRDNGIKRVEWITIEDDKVCKICAERDGKIYDIDNIPPKPHIGCRCYLLPVEE